MCVYRNTEENWQVPAPPTPRTCTCPTFAVEKNHSLLTLASLGKIETKPAVEEKNSQSTFCSKLVNSVWGLQVIDVLLSMPTLWWPKHSNILPFRGNLRFHFLIAQVWSQFKKLLPKFLSKSKQMIWDPHLRYFSFLGMLKDCKSIKCLTKFFTDLPAGRMDLRWAGRRGRSRLQSTSCGCLGSPWSSQRGSPWKSQFFIWNWCPGVLI